LLVSPGKNVHEPDSDFAALKTAGNLPPVRPHNFGDQDLAVFVTDPVPYLPKVFPILPDNIKYGLRGFFMENWLAKSIFLGAVILAAVVNFRIALNLIKRKFK
jgi:hypothetical protein